MADLSPLITRLSIHARPHPHPEARIERFPRCKPYVFRARPFQFVDRIPPKFRIMDLPAHLRLRILEYVLDFSNEVHFESSYPSSKPFHGNDFVSLRYTCRELYYQTQEVVAHSKTFVFCSTCGIESFVSTPHFFSWLERIETIALEISSKVASSHRSEARSRDLQVRLLTALRAFPRLHQLKLIFRWNISLRDQKSFLDLMSNAFPIEPHVRELLVEMRLMRYLLPQSFDFNLNERVPSGAEYQWVESLFQVVKSFDRAFPRDAQAKLSRTWKLIQALNKNCGVIEIKPSPMFVEYRRFVFGCKGCGVDRTDPVVAMSNYVARLEKRKRADSD